MIDVEMISDGNKILVSEHFLTFNDQPCEIKFILNNETLIMSLVFEDDEKIEKPSTKFDDEDGILVVKFINFDAILGRGNINPVIIGTNQGKKLFMNYWISKPSDQTNYRLVNITIYQEGD